MAKHMGKRSVEPGKARGHGAKPQKATAYGQHPVRRTLVTLAVALGICALIVGLGEAGILHYPEQPKPAPAATKDAHPDTLEDDGGNKDDSGSSVSAAQDGTGSVDGSASGQAAAKLIVSDKFEDMFEEGEVHSIRVIGDSITAGYGCDGYGTPSDTNVTVYSGKEGAYKETATTVGCWTNDFRAFALQHGVTSFVNAGVSGFRMQYLAEDPSSWLGDGADVIVVMLGTNDASRRTEVEFSADAEIGLAAAAAKCKLLIVVSPPNNARTDATNNFSMQRVNQVLTSLCRLKGYVHASFLNTLALYTADYNSDQCHPTSEGSHKLWAAFKEQLAL
ncbi:MAG: SGNH/GDSL hydrolase family protein [Parafannyhessea sp.]|uniref:SGNH/GDSL hydrolase family protein n=1 Tax=Parafannyhessea sp. TaxID=2847324 RepID=UPI003EFF9F70